MFRPVPRMNESWRDCLVTQTKIKKGALCKITTDGTKRLSPFTDILWDLMGDFHSHLYGGWLQNPTWILCIFFQGDQGEQTDIFFPLNKCVKKEGVSASSLAIHIKGKISKKTYFLLLIISIPEKNKYLLGK